MVAEASIPRQALVGLIACILGPVCLPPSTSAAEVSGRVVVLGTPHSVPPVRVTLRYLRTIPKSHSQEAAHVHPNANGSFTFLRLPAGIYVLEVDGTDVLSAQWGARNPGLAGQALVLRDTDHVNGLKLSTALKPKICGRAFAANGSPLAGAQVIASRTNAAVREMFGYLPGPPRPTATVSADGRGRFTLDHLDTGDYNLAAYVPLLSGDANPDRSVGIWKNAREFRDAALIRLDATSATARCSYDLHLQPGPKPYQGRRYRVEGSLIGEAFPVGKRPMQAMQWILRRLAPTMLESERYEWGAIFDPAHPVFSFAGVAPGRYRLMLGEPPPDICLGSCDPLWRFEVDQELIVQADILGLPIVGRPPATVRSRIMEVHFGRETSPWERRPPENYDVGLSSRRGSERTNASPDGTFQFTARSRRVRDRRLHVVRHILLNRYSERCAV